MILCYFLLEVDPQFFSDFARFPTSLFPSSLVSAPQSSSSRWLSPQSWQPIQCNVNLVESPDQNSLTMRAEMPGVAKEDIQLQIEGNRLALRAE